MNLRVFAVCLAASVLLAGLLFYRSQSLGLQTSITLQLTVFPESYYLNGSGYIFADSMNFSILKWLDSGHSAVDSKFLYLAFPENETRINPVTFNLLFYLNQTEKVIELTNFRNPGVYNATVLCFFDGIKSGSYNMTANLTVEGSFEVLDTSQFLIHVQ
jgi:hypothetical protein